MSTRHTFRHFEAVCEPYERVFDSSVLKPGVRAAFKTTSGKQLQISWTEIMQA